MKEDYFSQLDDYDEPFCEQQYKRKSCLFKFKSVDQFNPPEQPRILDIYSVVVKSVQSALSDLKRPPECLQSQCNYRPFIT